MGLQINRKAISWCVRITSVHMDSRMLGEKEVIGNVRRHLCRLTDFSATTRGLKNVRVETHDALNIAGLAPISRATIMV